MIRDDLHALTEGGIQVLGRTCAGIAPQLHGDAALHEKERPSVFGAPSPVEHTGGSYRISVTPDQLDALHFELTLTAARAGAEAGAPRESLKALKDA